jgi:hypothetical protein
VALDDLQRELAASLAAGSGGAPDGYDAGAIGRARKALESKRRRAAGHLLPRLRAALGSRWDERFQAHARGYTPAGLLHHVDDAWELAEMLLRAGEPELRRAAHDDLVFLRLRYMRNRKTAAERIRERRGPFLALLRAPCELVLRLPGGRTFFIGLLPRRHRRS